MKKLRIEHPVWYWMAVSATGSIILNGALLGAVNWYTISPFGHDALPLLFISFILGPFLLSALVALPSSLIFLVIPRIRKIGLIILAASSTYLLIAFPAMRIGNAIRIEGFYRMSQRAAPLVNAIETCSAKYGRPPGNLGQLVPEFLPSIPPTGMAAYPDWNYVAGEEAQEWDGNPWVLYIDCSYGLNFDRFMYFPKRNYPKHGYGGLIEQVGDWAYVHE